MQMHRLTEVDKKAKTAKCSECGYAEIQVRGDGRTRCLNIVREEWAREAERRKKLGWKNTYQRGKHGLTIAEAKERTVAVGRCEICGRTNNLCVDHDHVTGQLRGVLCDSCNNGLGRFRDNPVLLTQAAAYLKWYHDS